MAEVTNKIISLSDDEKFIAYQNEKDVAYREFILPLSENEVDLTLFDFFLEIIYGNGTTDIAVLTKSVGESITLKWDIGATNTIAQGSLKAQIRGTNGTEQIWKSGWVSFTVGASINAVEAQPETLPTEFAQFEQKILGYVQDTEDFAQSADTSAQNAEQAYQNAVSTLNNKQDKSDNALTTSDKTIVGAINELDGEIGNLSELETEHNATIVEAINIANTKANAAQSTADQALTIANETSENFAIYVMNNPDLQTTSKNVVGAINELDGEIGNLSELETELKSTIVEAINVANSKANAAQSTADNIGDVATLTTTEKTSLVGAVNEVNDLAHNAYDLANTKADIINGKVPASQLPSYVDDVLEYDNLASFPVIGETGKAYTAIDTGFTYRWSGTVYTKLNDVDLTLYQLKTDNTLTTSDKTIVGAINELDGDIGNLSDLETTEKTSVVGAINEVKGLSNIYSAIKEFTGFINNNNISVSYDSTTRKITLTTTDSKIQYAMNGIIYNLSETNTWTSDAHSTTLTNYYLYIPNGSSTPIWSTIHWNFYDVQIAYKSSKGFCLKETHGAKMDADTHREFHIANGTYRSSGGSVNFATYNSTTVSDRRPTITSTVLEDEDNQTSLPQQTNNYCFAELTGNGIVQFTTDQSEILKLNGNVPYYNSLSGNTWGNTAMSNNTYMCLWLLSIPTSADTTSQKYRYVWFMGQSAGSLTSQQTLTPNSVSLGDLANESPEYCFINKTIVRFTTGNWTVVSSDSISGTKVSQTISATNPAVWGGITGTLDNQTDLVAKFATKADNATILRTIVDLPVFTTQPTIVGGGSLGVSFKTSNEDYYFVTLYDMLVTKTQASAVFTTTTVVIAEPTATFSIGNVVSIGGCSILQNNKTATITGVSNTGGNTTYTFAASTFTAGTSTTTITMGTMTALPANQFKLMLFKDSPASAITQIFSLSSLNTGNSGTLVENTEIDFKTIGVSWTMRLHFASTAVTINLPTKMQTGNFSIIISGYIKTSGYIYLRFNEFDSNYRYVGNIANYDGNNGAIISPTGAAYAKFIIEESITDIIRCKKTVSLANSRTTMGMNSQTSSPTITKDYGNISIYKTDRADIDTISITQAYIGSIRFANHSEIVLKEII